ncbi:putative phosphatidate cytidylyltransferase [Escherichia coli]|nr:putative phosphatidate cytidylyltransferase [Escherichia coli]
MKLKNIHLYNYVVIYTKNCEIYINKGNEQVYIPPRTVAIFEKNISFNIETIRKGDGVLGNDSNLLIVFYVQIMPDDFVMQLHRF